MSNPVKTAMEMLQANADETNTFYRVLSEDQTRAILTLCNAYTLLDDFINIISENGAEFLHVLDKNEEDE